MVTPTARNALMVLLPSLALVACREAAAPARASGGDRYVVRGQIVRMPEPGAAPTLSIRHEAIPSFRDRTGAVVGMVPMVMPFPVAEGVSLDRLAPGDKIRFRFAMDWRNGRNEIESVEKLPPETVLEFGGAR